MAKFKIIDGEMVEIEEKKQENKNSSDEGNEKDEKIKELERKLQEKDSEVNRANKELEKMKKRQQNT